MITFFSDRIITWYQQNKRDLPWRQTKEPYKVWLSEIILQQTRVAQGLPYYEKFVNSYPTINDLAAADEQDVLKLWQGLGYYSRARNLHFTAKYISEDLDGKFPTTYNDLLKLKGVGDYTASAIASFCYNEVKATVDGNVFRVLARYFGVEISINTSLAKKHFIELAQELIDPKRPALFNQAIMEFGALQCAPKTPNCSSCPLNDSCIALQKNQVYILPKKEKKLKITKRYFNFLVLETSNQETILQQRKGKGIWQNLFEFPLVETELEVNFTQLFQEPKFLDIVEEQGFILQLLTPMSVIHKLSHQHLYIKFWLLKTDDWHKETLTIPKARSLPVPIVIHNFIDEFWPFDRE